MICIQQIHTKIPTIPHNRLEKVKIQQTIMATAQNITKIHNMEQKEIKNNKTITNLT